MSGLRWVIERWDRATGYIDNVARVFMGLALLGILSMLLLQILIRYILPFPAPWVEEMAVYMSGFVAMVGMSVCLRASFHLEVDILVNLFPWRARKIHRIFLMAVVERIIAVDRSDGMLTVARRKLAAAACDQQVVLAQASIDAVPLPDASVDGVMVNQVLHHLHDDPDAGYPCHRQVLRELARVLRPGGVFVINSCSHEQIQDGFWPYHLIPDAQAAVIRRLMLVDRLEAALEGLGMSPKGRFVPVDAVLQGSDYLDPRGPLRASWRAGDSIWALATEPELESATCRLRELDEQGELDAYAASHDVQRRRIGQITMLYGVKT